ncbi:MAG: hypothetical protein HC889_17345 [Synechococcaceae cyanobacterium SM1_2_3]|nr:hypothetical protein [Synechococcaceae cyanobacterium SM1_2_3]
MKDLQKQMRAWVTCNFGTALMVDPVERAARVLEEAVELAQASGVPCDRCHRLVDRSFSRPTGEIQIEAAQVGVAILTFCEMLQVDFNVIVGTEIERIHSFPVDYWRDRQNAKAAVGLGGKCDG